MGQTKQNSHRLVHTKTNHKLLLLALFVITICQSKIHYIDRSEAEASNDVSESDPSEKKNVNHDRHWRTATTEEIESHEDADEEELSTIKDRLENKLSMQAGIPVNLETPEPKKKQHETAANATTEENEEEESTTDLDANGEQKDSDKNNKRKGKNHLKHK